MFKVQIWALRLHQGTKKLGKVSLFPLPHCKKHLLNYALQWKRTHGDIVAHGCSVACSLAPRNIVLTLPTQPVLLSKLRCLSWKGKRKEISTIITGAYQAIPFLPLPYSNVNSYRIFFSQWLLSESWPPTYPFIPVDIAMLHLCSHRFQELKNFEFFWATADRVSHWSPMLQHSGSDP